MRDIRVAAVQMSHLAGDKRANFAKLRSFVSSAAEQRVELIVLPEMCLTGYWHIRKLSREEIDALAEPVPSGPSSLELIDLARRHAMTIGAGLIERAPDGALYNTYVVAMPDGHTARHRKIHCFISAHMASGSELTVFDTPSACRCGVLTCYDNNMIENVRLTALAGAEIVLAPHQTGGCDSPSPRAMGLIDPALWQNRHQDPAAIEAELRGPKGRAWLLRWLPSRAHDNGVFYIFSNGVGIDDNEVRTGNAMILDPYGEILAETWQADDALVVADLRAEDRHMCTGVRWMKSRRPELYGPLAVPTGNERETRELRFARAENRDF
jgi:predicted amidohydrolase